MTSESYARHVLKRLCSGKRITKAQTEELIRDGYLTRREGNAGYLVTPKATRLLTGKDTTHDLDD